MTEEWGSWEHRGLTRPRQKAAQRKRSPRLPEFHVQELLAEQMGVPLSESERNEIALTIAQQPI